MSFDFPTSDPFASPPTSSTADGPDWNSLGAAASTTPTPQSPQASQAGRPGGYPGVVYATQDPPDEGKRTLLIALVAAVAIFLCMGLVLFLASKSNDQTNGREGAEPLPEQFSDEQPPAQNPAAAEPGRNRKPVLASPLPEHREERSVALQRQTALRHLDRL